MMSRYSGHWLVLQAQDLAKGPFREVTQLCAVVAGEATNIFLGTRRPPPLNVWGRR